MELFKLVEEIVFSGDMEYSKTFLVRKTMFAGDRTAVAEIFEIKNLSELHAISISEVPRGSNVFIAGTKLVLGWTDLAGLEYALEVLKSPKLAV